MPGDLFGSAAGLLESAGAQAQETANREQRTTDTTVKQGDAASAQLGEDQRQKMAQDQQTKMAMLKSKLDQQENSMEITPQIALGLVKNTGDKEWMKAIGTKMRSDVVLGMYQHGINSRFAGKEYKVPVGDKIVTIIPRYNKDTNDWDFSPVGEGEKFSPTQKGEDTEKAKADRAARERIARDKASKKGGGEAPEDKEFLKTYRSNQKDTEGMNAMMLSAMAKKDPDRAKELQAKLDFVQKNADRFNKLQGVKPDVSGGTAPDQPEGKGQPGAPGQGGDEVITIKDSQGQTHQIFKKNLEAAKKRDAGLKVVS